MNVIEIRDMGSSHGIENQGVGVRPNISLIIDGLGAPTTVRGHIMGILKIAGI